MIAKENKFYKNQMTLFNELKNELEQNKFMKSWLKRTKL